MNKMDVAELNYFTQEKLVNELVEAKANPNSRIFRREKAKQMKLFSVFATIITKACEQGLL